MNHATRSPETPAERQARQLETCRRLTELALRLAEAAAEKAIAELATTQTTPETPTRAGALFANLTRTIRSIILLELRILVEKSPAPVSKTSKPMQDAPPPIDEKLFASLCKELGLDPAEAEESSPFLKKRTKKLLLKAGEPLHTIPK